MARAVYSARFLAVGASAPFSATYVVPTGYLAVVRDITALLPSEAGLISVTGSAANRYLFYRYGATTGYELVSQPMRTVLNAGETLTATGSGSINNASVLVSGYLLTV